MLHILMMLLLYVSVARAENILEPIRKEQFPESGSIPLGKNLKEDKENGKIVHEKTKKAEEIKKNPYPLTKESYNKFNSDEYSQELKQAEIDRIYLEPMKDKKKGEMMSSSHPEKSNDDKLMMIKWGRHE